MAETTSDLPATVVPAGRLYTSIAVSVRRTYLFSLAILVSLLVSLYPYLGAMEMCHPGECPHATQASTQSSTGTAGLAGLCLGAVLAASSVGVLVFGALRGFRFFGNDARPGDVFLSFDPPPPRLSPSR